jgi:uncharacterized protein
VSSIDNLKKEAKRRLKALRQNDPAATLRGVQHALAREHGFESWAAMRRTVEHAQADPLSATELLDAAERGTLSPEAWREAFAAFMRRDPNAVRAGYAHADLIVTAAAKAPGFVIETLVRHGAATNVVAVAATAPEGARRFLPLHNAGYHGNADAAEVLLKYGADPMARDATFKRTAADWAEAGGHLDLRDRLRDAARELLDRRREANETRDPMALFLYSACWDHHVHGAGDHRMHDRAAQRLLAAAPEMAAASIYTAIVCGEIEEVRRRLHERPEAAREAGGPRRWTPLLYLCYTRFTHPATLANTEAIARLLLDHGADPNDFYMAGDSQYTALVGVAGEGEQDSPRQPWAEAVFALLLERGAAPFDIQVLYNTHFHGDVLWWLELVYESTRRTPLAVYWDDPDWKMLDMGGYGNGARFLLWIALKERNLRLAEWCLSRGANPNAPPPRATTLPQDSLYACSLREQFPEMAALLVRYGAEATLPLLGDEQRFERACFALDREAAQALAAAHPEYLAMPKVLFKAAQQDRPDVLALLADLGMPLDVRDAKNTSALHHAAGGNARRAAAFLLERGVEIDPRETNWGGRPIGWASHGDHAEMIDLLSLHSRSIWPLTFRGYVDRVREILAEDTSPAREVAPDGSTPLWWLPDDEERALVLADLLIAAGADPAAKNGSGRTAADWARRRGMFAVARRLESARRSD